MADANFNARDGSPSGSSTQIPDLADPRQPHDHLPFEELGKRYNFQLTSNRPRVFTRLVIEECQKRPSPVRLLDVGCGRGIAQRAEYQWAMRPSAEEFWGIDPDATVPPEPGLFDHHQHASVNTARLPADYFDLAYSYMVMEHVVDPGGFMQAVWRCLRPGGVYLFTTPNKRHYFTRIASALHSLHLDELVLRIIKRKSIDTYHYAVQYRFNDERCINACAERLGFLPPEYAYLEAEGLAGYLPGPLRPVFHLLALKRKLVRNPQLLITMICRITKPTGV